MSDRDAVAAFELLGHDIRFEIVTELANLSARQWRPRGVSYAELRRAVGVEDGGKFNYHLDELRGRFVEQYDDEYVPTAEAMTVANTVRRGWHSDEFRALSEPCGLEAPCGAGELALSFGEGYATLECPDHGVVHDNRIPPAAVEGRDAAAVAELVLARSLRYVRRAMRGECPDCSGRIAVTAPAPFDDADRDEIAGVVRFDDDVPFVRFDCDRCVQRFWLPVGTCLLPDPDVVAFCRDHGLPAGPTALVRLRFVASNYDAVEAIGDGVRLRYPVEEETLVGTVYDGGDVTVSRRS